MKSRATRKKIGKGHCETDQDAVAPPGARRLIPLPLIALTPPALFGLAVAAMAVLFKLGDPGLHRLGLWLIWVPTALISALAVTAGIIEARIAADESKGALSEKTEETADDH